MNTTALTTRTQHLLSFDSHEIKTVQRDGQMWMSGTEVGKALQYADPDTAIKKLYNRNADEFSPMMSKVMRVMTAGGKQAVRFFSLRGAHLLAMFARTEKAKAFRVWVLNILDREVQQERAESAARKTIDQNTLFELEGLCRETDVICAWWRKFGGAIETLNPKLSGSVREQFLFAQARAKEIQRALGFKSARAYMEEYPWMGSYTDREYHRRQCVERGIA